MKEFLENLTEQERRLLIIGVSGLALLLFYWVLWAPMSNNVSKLEKRIKKEQADLVWMKQAEQEVRALKSRSGGNRSAVFKGQSLLGLIDKTAKANRIPPAKRIEPDGKNGVRVRLEKVSFDKLILWLGRLQRDYQVNVKSIVVDSEPDPGLVNVRLNLEGPEPG